MKVPSPIVVQVSKDMSSQRVYKYQICISNHNKRIAITELGDKAEISEGMRYRLGAMDEGLGRPALCAASALTSSGWLGSSLGVEG